MRAILRLRDGATIMTAHGAVELLIHKGASEIGGTCISLSYNGTTILLDAGEPLSADSASVDYGAIRADAVFISHPHQDHYGRLSMLNGAIPVYMGRAGRSLVDAAALFTGKESLRGNFNDISHEVPVTVGPFTVTSLLVDHSAIDAYCFLIQAGDVRILYSGDFRAHGRKAILFERFISNPPKDVDCLLLEGTMLGRDNQDFPDESAVEDAIVDALHTQNALAFMIASSQNIDRLVSAYRACRRTGRVLVVDLYTAWVLEQMRVISERVPAVGWESLGIYADFRHDAILKSRTPAMREFRSRAYRTRITREALQANPERYLWLVKMSRYTRISAYVDMSEKPVTLIYSQWKGYLGRTAEECFGSPEITRMQSDPRIRFVYVHTSGHAVIEDLQRLVNAVEPRRIIPVHTAQAACYEKYFNAVEVVSDGKPYVVRPRS